METFLFGKFHIYDIRKDNWFFWIKSIDFNFQYFKHKFWKSLLLNFTECVKYCELNSMRLPNINDAHRIKTDFEYVFQSSGRTLNILLSYKANSFEVALLIAAGYFQVWASSTAMRSHSANDEDRPSRAEKKADCASYFIGTDLIFRHYFIDWMALISVKRYEVWFRNASMDFKW